MSNIVQSKVWALSGAPVVALSVKVGRSAGRTLPSIVHGGGLTPASIAVIVAVVAAAVAVAVLGWRLTGAAWRSANASSRTPVVPQALWRRRPVARRRSRAPRVATRASHRCTGSPDAPRQGEERR